MTDVTCEVQSNSPVLDVRQELNTLIDLEMDWDDEGAPAIHRIAIQRAHTFIEQLAETQRAHPPAEFLLNMPAVYPSIEGGLQLHWNYNGKQTLLCFHPGDNRITCRTKEVEKPVSQLSLTTYQAIYTALRPPRPNPDSGRRLRQDSRRRMSKDQVAAAEGPHGDPQW